MLKRLSDQRLRHQPTAFEPKCTRVVVGVDVDSKNGEIVGIDAEKRSWLGGYCQPLYADVLWLQQYDKGLLAEPKVQTGGVLPTYTKAT